MAIPDFTVKTPAVSPDAIATILQRRRQIENEQKQAEDRRRQETLNSVVSAVESGSRIASNMMDIAEKRNHLSQARKQQAAVEQIQQISQEPDTLPEPTLSPEDNQKLLESYKADKIRRLEAAYAGANPQDYVRNKMEQMGGGKEFAPQQGSIELKNGKIIPAVFKGGDYYYPNSDEKIPSDEIVGKGYGLNFTTDAAGNQIGLSRSTGRPITTASTAAPGTQEPTKEADNIFVLPAPRRTEFVRTVETSKNDPQFRGEVQKVLNASTFERSLAAQNQILDSGAPLQFRKVFGDAGNISIVEQQASEGDQQAYQKAKQLVEKKLSSGKLTEHNRQIMKDGLKVLRESAQKNLLLQTELQAKSMKSQYPELSERLISENILGKSVYTSLKKKYPNVSSEFTGDDNNTDKQVDDFFLSLLKD